MDSTAIKGRTRGTQRGLPSLFVALVLVTGFAAVFYLVILNSGSHRQVLMGQNDIPTMEKMIVEEVEKGKEEKASNTSANLKEHKTGQENFTFYRTLTRDIKKPVVDPSAELARLNNADKVDPPKDREVPKKIVVEKNLSESSPKPGPAKSAVKYYSVQLASFDDFDRAEIMKRSLDRKGYKTFIVAASGESKGRYRVRVGKFKEIEDAKLLSGRLGSKESLRPIIVKE